jgi:hypothetical protein
MVATVSVGRRAAGRPQRRLSGVGALAAAGLLALVAGACGSTDGPAGAEDPPPATELAPGDSGAFALATVPEGYAIARAYADRESDRKSINYLQGGDEDLPGWTIAAGSWPEDQPPFAELMRMAKDHDESGEMDEVEVHGRTAHLGPYTSDGQVVGSSVVWEERPGYVVELRVSDGAGVDPVALADDTYEISDEAFEALRVGTTGVGSTPGARIDAVTGTVDGDPYVLTAVLPDGYPVEPIDVRAGCAELTFRGETATTCTDQFAFAPLDDSSQAVLGGVSFAFGVFRDGLGEVLIAPIESPAGPWERTNAAVVAEAPELTWFVASFPQVCDRSAFSKSGSNQGIGVPPGYPHSTCD